MAIYSFSPFGYDGSLVTVEVDLRRGIPAVDIVGISDGCVKETRERMFAAIRNSGFEFPAERVLISLSPADLKKEGAGFDLPIALDVLRCKSLRDDCIDEDVGNAMVDTNVLVMGELELSGRVKPVRAVHGACTTAIASGIEYAILPKGSDVPTGIKVCEVETLKEAFDALINIGSDKYFKTKGVEVTEGFSTKDSPVFGDVSDDESLDKIEGHNALKYAMAVAAAGRHSILTYGAPGCGKTMVLQRMPQLTPKLTFDEAQSVTRIYSLAGLMRPGENYITDRPFRMPHQTASIEGVCGGGINCRPGEISLAHNGVLFLDEAAEFRTSVLQMLRVPMESSHITLSRAGRTTVYPAKFQLVMATNPCPCGNYGRKDKICLCSAKSIEMYWRKFSAPLLDRVAIRVDAEGEFKSKELNDGTSVLKDWKLSELRQMISKAWKVQYERQGKLNQDLTPAEVTNIQIEKNANELLMSKSDEYSPRQIANILKVARTIADMNGGGEITESEVKLALELHGNTPMDILL